MATLEANGIQIEYDERGNKDAPAVLLIMGIGCQMLLWSDAFCDALADKGFRVIRFDNRDVGLSEHMDAAGKPNILEAVQRAMTGQPVMAAYTLNDMALDAVGVLDALDVEAAHIVGASMGGMIAQIVAAEHAGRTRSLTSIMSSSGRPTLPPPTPAATAALLTPPSGTDRESIIENGVQTWKVLASPDYPPTDGELRERLGMLYDRANNPAGFARQYLAILGSGSRVDLLKTIGVPSLVIHGLADPLIPVECGRDTAELIPGAKLKLIEGMGHDFPPVLMARIAEMIAEQAGAVESVAA